MRVSGVVHRLNRILPRTEPFGTPHVREDEGEVRWNGDSRCEMISVRR